MKIAYFASTMDPAQDGVARYLYLLIDALKARDIEHLFVAAKLPESSSFPIIKVPSIVFPLYRDYRLAMPGTRWFARALDEFKPDMIHIHAPDALGFAAASYAKSRGIPAVATYHTHFISYLSYYKLRIFSPLVWALYRKLYNKMEHTFVPSRFILEELERHGIKNLVYLPHGADTTKFNPKFKSGTWRKKVGANGKQILLFVSRLVWEKNLRVLAAAHRELKEKRDDFVLVIVGDGPARKELEKLLPGAVFFGFQSGEELSTAYASSDFFVFPSVTETFGLVSLEAMSSGIPVVGANAEGTREVVEDGVTGFLARANDASDFAEKIGRLLDDKALVKKFGAESLAFAEAHSWEKIFAKTVDLYKRTIEQAKK